MTYNPLARFVGAATRFVSRQLTSSRVAFLWTRSLSLSFPDSVAGPVNLAGIRKILVVRLDEIGDVVLTTPLLRELKRQAPHASISLVVKPAIRNLFEHCPYVDEVLQFDPSSSFYWAPLNDCVSTRRFSQDICRPRNFDLAILPRWDTDWCHASFIPYFSGIRYRMGFSESVNREKQNLNRGYDRLLSHALADALPRHEVERGLGLLNYMGVHVEADGVELFTSREDDAFAELLWRSQGISGDETVIVFGPGARHPRKIWPLENFIKLGGMIRDQVRCRILVCGDRSETERGKGLKQDLGNVVIDLTGHTTLRQTVALYRRCHLFIGNDSGPKHLAAGAGLPTIEISWSDAAALSVPTSTVSRFRPWKVPYRIVSPERLIAPCSMECTSNETHCIAGVSVSRVAETVFHALRDTAQKPR